MQRIPPPRRIIRLRRLQKRPIRRPRKQRIRQIPEKLLQQTRHSRHIVKEILRVPEIQLRVVGVMVESVFQLRRVLRVAVDAVYPFVVQAVGVDGLDALHDDGGDGGLVALEEVGEADAEDGADGR